MNKRTIIPVVAAAIALGYGTADTAFADMRHRSHHGPHGRHRGMEYGHDRPPADAATIQQRHVRKYAGELKEMFDTSHDGTLSANERAKMLSEMADAERLQRYVLPWRVIREIDADSDFLVTDQELESFSSATEKVRREYEERRAQRATNPAMRHGGGHRSGRADRPKGADGIKLWRDFDKATPADLKTLANDLRRKYDKDGDGKLTGDERTTLDAELSRAEELQRYVLPWKVIKEVDADGNLEISEEESKRISSVMQKLRPEFEAGRRGGRDEPRHMHPNHGRGRHMHPHHGRGRHGIRDEGDSRRHAPSR